MKLSIMIAILLGFATSAMAKPPPNSDPDSPIAHWYRSLEQPTDGVSCCAEADCRPVDYRIARQHYEVFIDRKTFGESAPDNWLPVPNDTVISHVGNPTGSGVACYLSGKVLCFVAGPQG